MMLPPCPLCNHSRSDQPNQTEAGLDVDLNDLVEHLVGCIQRRALTYIRCRYRSRGYRCQQSVSSFRQPTARPDPFFQRDTQWEPRIPKSPASSFAVASSTSNLRLAMTTFAPASANRAAIAFPIPRPPPVTIAVLPSSGVGCMANSVGELHLQGCRLQGR